jgi:hypothetical protein
MRVQYHIHHRNTCDVAKWTMFCCQQRARPHTQYHSTLTREKFCSSFQARSTQIEPIMQFTLSVAILMHSHSYAVLNHKTITFQLTITGLPSPAEGWRHEWWHGDSGGSYHLCSALSQESVPTYRTLSLSKKQSRKWWLVRSNFLVTYT